MDGSKSLRSCASTRSSSSVATRRRPLRGRQQATGLAARMASGRSRVMRLLRRPIGSRQGRAQVATSGRLAARSSRRRRSSSRLSRGTQRARWGYPSPLLSSIWGIQRPRATRLRAQRCRWLHQRSSSARSGFRPDRGRRESHSVAAEGSTARPWTCHGHHSVCFGIGSPACIGRPVQMGSSGAGSAVLLRLLRGFTVRLGRVRQAVASMLPPGNRSRS